MEGLERQGAGQSTRPSEQPRLSLGPGHHRQKLDEQGEATRVTGRHVASDQLVDPRRQ